MALFNTFGLDKQLLDALEAAGFAEPTEIQARALPLLLEGRDMLATAPTGMGKTAAYLLPILNRLAEKSEKPIPKKPRVLILAPTRELAGQIGESLRQFSKGMRLYYTVVYGGTPYATQNTQITRGVHIMIATPGRLMDHLNRGTLTLDQVDCFVLDEADRMLDMGFVDEVREVAKMLPKEHQTVMFSATMSRAVRGLASALLSNPGLIEIGRENTVAVNVDHRVMRVKYPDKKPLLLNLLARPGVSRVLVFTRTKAMADELVRDVQEAGFEADAIHGDLKQAVRQKVLRKFKLGTINILIATDVAARGIDVPDITHVINYDMPAEAEAYIHRVGRTGRASAKGTALSICVANEGGLLHQIERLIGVKVPVDTDHPFHDDRAAASRGPRSAPGKSPRPFNKGASERKAGGDYKGAVHRKGPPRRHEETGIDRDAAPRDDSDRLARKPHRKTPSYRDDAPSSRPDKEFRFTRKKGAGDYNDTARHRDSAPDRNAASRDGTDRPARKPRQENYAHSRSEPTRSFRKDETGRKSESGRTGESGRRGESDRRGETGGRRSEEGRKGAADYKHAPRHRDGAADRNAAPRGENETSRKPRTYRDDARPARSDSSRFEKKSPDKSFSSKESSGKKFSGKKFPDKKSSGGKPSSSKSRFEGKSSDRPAFKSDGGRPARSAKEGGWKPRRRSAE